MKKTFIIFFIWSNIAHGVPTNTLKNALENLSKQLKNLEKFLTPAKRGPAKSAPKKTPASKSSAVKKTPATSTPAKNAPYETLEKQILAYTNDFRAKHKKPPLQWDDKLAVIARQHSAYMVKKTEGKNDIAHLSRALNHDNAEQRLNYYKWRGGYAENVAFTSYPDVARNIVDGWINSPGHRANMLSANAYCGIGLEKGPGKSWYATQIFSQSP